MAVSIKKIQILIVSLLSLTESQELSLLENLNKIIELFGSFKTKEELTWVTYFAQRHHVSLLKGPFTGILKDCAHNSSTGQKQTGENSKGIMFHYRSNRLPFLLYAFDCNV